MLAKPNGRITRVAGFNIKISFMKKIYLLGLGALMSASTFGQTIGSVEEGKPFQFVGATELPTEGTVSTLRATETCSDTSRWAWGRSFNGGQPSYFSTFMHADTLVPNSYGTYVPVPMGQSVDVSGFSFYGLSLRPDGNPVTVNAVLYAAGADSLPMGAALASIAVSLDTSTSNFIEPMLQEVDFGAIHTMTGGFVVSIENSAVQGDSIQVLRGFTGSGAADDFPVVLKAIDLNNGDYTRLPGTTFGARLPHIYPYIMHNQANGFSMSVTKLSGPNEDVDFTYLAPQMTDNPVLSISGFVGDTTSNWNFQDGSAIMVGRDVTHTFVDPTKDYQVNLTDSILLWNASYCILSESSLLEKAWTVGINDVENTEVVAYVSNGVIRVENAEGLATVYSITGQIVRQAYVNGSEQTINVSDLKGGVYILSVNDKAIKLKL